MTQHLSEDETLAAVPPLTRTRLAAWIAAEVVVPVPTPRGPAFRELDVARLALACELADEFELAADALALVLTLVDRLNRAEADLAALTRALASEQEDIRRRIGAGLQR